MPRKKTPLAIRAVQGDTRKIGRHKLEQLIAAEPHAQRGLPGPPDHLDETARMAWGFWSEELRAMDLDRRPDAMMLEGACVAYSRAVTAEKDIQAKGQIVETPIVNKDGDVVGERLKPNPSIAIANGSWTLVHRFASEFGLSPASRARVAAKRTESAGDDLAAILNAPREPRTPAVLQ